MAMTFRALCSYADWSEISTPLNADEAKSPGKMANESVKHDPQIDEQGNRNGKMNLHYNIQIHLPETTNMAVYDAIFQSLKKHLY